MSFGYDKCRRRHWTWALETIETRHARLTSRTHVSNMGQRETQTMKVTKVQPVLADRFLFARIETDEGIVGLGESGAWGHLEASATALKSFGEYLVGKDPRQIEYHWNVMQRATHFSGAALMGAISAIDIALWDIKGKALGVPVYELLGGAMRRKARVYGHAKGETIEILLERCMDLKERGFTAIGHLNPFLDERRDTPYFKPHARKIHDAIENVRRVREAVGHDIDICLEIHRRLTVSEAIAVGRSLEAFLPLFLEDPIPPGNFDAMAWVADHVSLAIATGERLTSLYAFQTLISRNAAQYLRPSICLCGGITGVKKIAAMAEASELQIVPHNALSPVCLGASLQIAASIPNFAIQEYPNSGVGWNPRDGSELRGADLVRGTPAFAEGFVDVPDAPGIGVELVPDIEARFPPIRRPVAMRPHVDGSIVDQ